MDRIAKGVIAAAALAVGVAAASPAAARSPQSGALDRCLAAKTTRADRAALVRWTFAVAALSPDLADLAVVDPAKRDAATQQAATVFNRLAFTDCKAEMAAAVRADGQSALQQSLARTAQDAIQERLTEPEVAGGVMALIARLDLAALTRLLLDSGRMPLGGAAN